MKNPKLVFINYCLPAIAVVFVAGLAYAASFTPPLPGTVPPASNIEPPITSGAATAYKAGALGIGGLFETDAETHLALLAGKVGVGTSAPVEKLQIVGKALADDFCLNSDKTKCLSAASVAGPCSGTAVLSSSGIFVAPDCATAVTIELWSGGGGGGGGGGPIGYLCTLPNFPGPNIGGGGGGGGAGGHKKMTVNVAPGTSYAVTVGAGGTGGGGGAIISGWTSTDYLCAENGGRGDNGGSSSVAGLLSVSGGGGGQGGHPACRDNKGLGGLDAVGGSGGTGGESAFDGQKGNNWDGGGTGGGGTYGQGGSGGSGGIGACYKTSGSYMGSSGVAGEKGADGYAIISW